MSDIRGRNGRKLMVTCVLLIATGAAPAAAGSAGDLASSVVRGGAGLRAGTWNVVGLESPANGSSWESVAAEGWFQKGLDRNLVLESTLGFWQRNLTTSESGSLGEQTDRERQVYLVPTMTAAKLYPVTNNSTPLEPFLLAGVGLALGIEREEVTSTDPLVATGTSTRMQAGLGLQTGVGVEWRSGGPFGLTASGRYQWATFSEQVGGKGLYRGPGFMAGVTYRFTP